MLGVGAQHTKDPDGIAWKQNRDFENLLKRLNANSEDPTEDEVDSAPIDGFHPARVDDPIVDTATVELETEGRIEGREVEKERKNKKKKRRRDDDEVSKMERKARKRKKVESTTTSLTCEPAEVDPSSSNSPTLETIAFVVIYHSHSNASLTLESQHPRQTLPPWSCPPSPVHRFQTSYCNFIGSRRGNTRYTVLFCYTSIHVRRCNSRGRTP